MAAIASCVLVVVVLSPVTRCDPYDDGFPLSTYPMFGSVRPTLHKMSYALGVTRSGERRLLSPRLIGSGEVLQAYRIVEDAVATRSEARKLCTAIAERVRASGDDEVVTIRIVTATHDALAVLLDDRLAPERDLLRCAVPR